MRASPLRRPVSWGLRCVTIEAPKVHARRQRAKNADADVREGAEMLLIVGVDVDQRVHRVLVAADHGSGGGGQREEPDCVRGFQMQGTGPNCLLVEKDSFWGSEEGDGRRFWRKSGAGYGGGFVLRLGGVWQRGSRQRGTGGVGHLELGRGALSEAGLAGCEEEEDGEAEGGGKFGVSHRHLEVRATADCTPCWRLP